MIKFRMARFKDILANLQLQKYRAKKGTTTTFNALEYACKFL